MNDIKTIREEVREAIAKAVPEVCGGCYIHHPVLRTQPGSSDLPCDCSANLEDVLRAMHLIMARPGDWIMDVGGQFWEIIGDSSDGSWATHPKSVRWALGKSYDEQPDETISFLHSILV